MIKKLKNLFKKNPQTLCSKCFSLKCDHGTEVPVKETNCTCDVTFSTDKMKCPYCIKKYYSDDIGI